MVGPQKSLKHICVLMVGPQKCNGHICVFKIGLRKCEKHVRIFSRLRKATTKPTCVFLLTCPQAKKKKT